MPKRIENGVLSLGRSKFWSTFAVASVRALGSSLGSGSSFESAACAGAAAIRAMTNDSDATRALPDMYVPPNPGAIDSGEGAEIKGALAPDAAQRAALRGVVRC